MKHLFPVSLAALALAAFTSYGAAFGAFFQMEGIKGTCLVRRPGQTDFESATKGKAYPYGTEVCTLDKSGAALRLNEDDSLELGAGTVLTPVCAAQDDGRALQLGVGHITIFTATDGGDGLVVRTPVADCTGLKGRSEVTLAELPDAYDLSVQAASGGAVTIAGPQFTLPDLKAGYSVRIRTLKDRSYTRILNTLGDYAVLIDNGNPEPVSIAMTTRAAIKIWREKAPKSGRDVVSVLAIGADGRGRERFAFVVGQPLMSTAVTQDWVEEEKADGEAAADEGGADEGSGEESKDEGGAASADDFGGGDDLWE